MTVGITIVPFARNLWKNPRPASLLHVAAGGGASVLLVNDRSYVGGRAVYATLPPGGVVDWFSGGAGSIGGATTGEARTFAVAVRTSGTPNAPRVRLLALYADGTATLGDPLDGAAGGAGLGFAAAFPPTVTTEPAKTLSRLAVRVENAGAAEVRVYLGGADAREGSTYDRYVDGDQGEGFRWEGAANDSPSVREAATISPVRGVGGQISASVAVYLVDRRNRILDDLSPYFAEGSVSYNLDNEASKGTCSLAMTRRDLIDPLSDTYFRPHLTIDYPDGRQDSGSLGLFGVSWPNESYGDATRRWAYEGHDLLWVLAQDTVDHPGYLLGRGFDYRAMVLLVLHDAGFDPPHNVLLPDPPGREVSPADFGAGSGGSRLALVTQILEGAGWAKPWATTAGQIASAPIAPIASRQPAVRYASGPHSKVRFPFEATPEPANVGNRVAVSGVRVIRRKHRVVGHQQIRAVVANTNPAHPLSYQRLGRWVDLPPINAGLLASQAQAEALGRAAIEKAGMMPVRATLTTQVDIRQVNEVYELALNDPVTGEPIASGQGRYACTGWSMQLSNPWVMSHSLYRVVPLEGTV